MDLLNIAEMTRITKKHFMPILALSLAAGLLGGCIMQLLQTYTCTLGFKYNHEEAIEGLAPDGESKLDPYEIQNPVVIQAALKDMGFKANDSEVRGIRQNISINRVITELDKEITESAALLGEKYDVAATEYEMKFTYSAMRGDEFGRRMFSSIINEYDKLLLAKYYNKKIIDDFAKVIKDSNAEYIVIADTMSIGIDGIIDYLDSLSEEYPNFRSKTTGYDFAGLSLLYQNLRDIQYAKYYGNIRAGNLAKDKEMVIKSYQSKVKELKDEETVDKEISKNYEDEITTFYDSYKESGLYNQAKQVQNNTDSSNNRDRNVVEDKELEDYTNTYDNIVYSYTDYAGKASDAKHTAEYYNTIINSYKNDTVSKEIKDSLIEKNKTVLDEVSALSARYCSIANKTIDELYNSKVTNDLQYLIMPEVTTDKPVKLIAVFLMILTFGLTLTAAFITDIIKKIAAASETEPEYDDDIVVIDTENMDEIHRLLYEQYRQDFDEFFLVYQSMRPVNEGDTPHSEVFIRWVSERLGFVSPKKLWNA